MAFAVCSAVYKSQTSEGEIERVSSGASALNQEILGELVRKKDGYNH
jgi:hypothetical protein